MLDVAAGDAGAAPYKVAFIGAAPGGIWQWRSVDEKITSFAAGYSADPSFASDGTALATSTFDSGLVVLSAAGVPLWSRSVAFKASEPYNFRPALDPTGSYAVLTVLGDAGTRQLVSCDASACTELASSVSAAGAALSPASSLIAFESPTGIATAHLDMTAIVTVVPYAAKDRGLTDPSFSFDGTQLTFIRCLANSTLNSCEVDTVDLKTQQVVALTNADSWKWSPHFVPDGSAVVYVDNDVASEGSYFVRRVSVATRAIDTLASTSGGAFEPNRIALARDAP